MNRGLGLALILLSFAITLIGLDAYFVNRCIERNERLLEALSTDEICSEEEEKAVMDVYKRERLLLAISVSEGYLNEYEEALCALSASVKAGETDAYVAARAEALGALTQIKRSALVSLGQIF